MSINTSYSPQVIPLYWFNPIDKLRFYLLLLYDDVTRNYISVEFSVHVPIFMFLLWGLPRRKKKSKERGKKRFLTIKFSLLSYFPLLCSFSSMKYKKIKKMRTNFFFFLRLKNDGDLKKKKKRPKLRYRIMILHCYTPILFPFLLTFFVVILLLGICGPLSRKIHPLFYLDFFKY